MNFTPCDLQSEKVELSGAENVNQISGFKLYFQLQGNDRSYSYKIFYVDLFEGISFYFDLTWN